jgi:hypothetical protein
MLTLSLVVAVAAYVCVVHWILQKKFMKRLEALERDLLGFSDMMSQMTEIQMKIQKNFSANFEDLEERILELSVPSQDSDLPLERRHQVLTLARKGLGLKEITKRLKAPVGEAELVLNLSKYVGGESSRSARIKEQRTPYA